MSDKLLIIPAYNEEKRIQPVLNESLNYAFDYLFYCDGTDSTPDVIFNFYKKNKLKDGASLRVAVNDVRMGKGGAIMASIFMLDDIEADYKYIGYVDADGSVPLREMDRLFSYLEKSSLDGVIGSRWSSDANVIVKQPNSRRFYSRLLNIIATNLFGFEYRDTQCGAKVFRADIFRDVVKEDCVGEEFEFDIDLLWRMKKRGYTIKEVGIEWSNNVMSSKVKLTTAFSMLYDLIKIRMIG
jgi:glycosyltransferase involved in cell wall biosynthesis